MIEFRLSSWNARIIEHEQEVTEGIKNQFESLLKGGGRITANGAIVFENGPQTPSSYTIRPKTNESLGYFFDRGIHIVTGNQSFEPIDAFANYLKSALEKNNLLNPRIKPRHITELILIEIAKQEGIGRINNPNQRPLSAA